VQLPEGGPARVLGAEPEFTLKHRLYAWVQPPKVERWWEEGESGATPALINESFSVRYGVGREAVLDLPTPEGTRRVRVAGVYADYGNERGSITLPRANFAQWFHTDMAWRVAIMLKSDADAEAARARVQEAYPGLSVFSNARLQEEALRIFRQTFSVTYSVEVIGVVVAMGGLGLALVSLFLERRQDLTTLRALGMTHRELASVAAAEGLGMALAGALQGLAAGVWLGWLLIYRINKQCFGWTLAFFFPWGQILALALAVIGTGAVVAALVGRWGARLPADQED
jgi:putative ABC transport system permease protein